LAARIKDATDVETELIKGEGGVFEVIVDGKLIFSKKEQKRFPDDDEVLSQLPT